MSPATPQWYIVEAPGGHTQLVIDIGDKSLLNGEALAQLGAFVRSLHSGNAAEAETSTKEEAR